MYTFSIFYFWDEPIIGMSLGTKSEYQEKTYY